jgi:hypothetical protein
MRIKRQTGSFVAKDDQGKTYRVAILTEFIESVTNEGSMEIEGLKELRLDTGEAVNRVRQGKYRIVDTGLLLKSISEAAP